jgi:hypothetical protein
MWLHNTVLITWGTKRGSKGCLYSRSASTVSNTNTYLVIGVISVFYLFWNISKYSVLTSQEADCVIIMKTDRLMSFREMNIIYRDKYTKHTARGGVQLGPLGTAATNRPIVPSPGDYDDGEIGGVMIGKGNRSTRRKSAPVPLRPPQIPHACPDANLICRCGEPATNRLTYGTAC